MKSNIIIKSILAGATVTFLVACGGQAVDKKTELDNLKKDQASLKEKIAKLEAELALTDTAKKAKGKNVAISEMQQSPFTHYIEVQAKVEGDEDVSISPETMGTVTAVLVKAGDKVSKGQLLATLDDKIMKQSMATMQTQLDLATTLYNKQKNLWDQKIGSEVQYLSSKTQKEALENQLATVREQWQLTRMTSPINGTVDEVDIKVGQGVAPGMPVMRVVNLNDLKVRGEIAEAYISTVKTGNDVVVFFPDRNKEIQSKLSYAGRAINKLNRTFNVEVRLTPKDGELNPNMIAVLKIADYKNAGAYTVPVGAVMKSSEGEFVFVAMSEGKNTVAKRKAVTTGMSYNGTIEIKGGLSDGDKVVTTGFQNLVEGDLISL